MEHDQSSMDELLARGLKSVPVTIWNDDVVIGFNPKELARLFDLNSEVAVVDLPTMVEKYETILTGAARAIRQIPEEKGEWESPERQRTIRQFTFHLCDRPDRALNAHDVGRYANEDRGREVEQVLGGKATFEEIAQYGEDVLRRIKSALASPISLDLDKVLETYMGDKTAGEMLDLGLGHSVHHLKQLYSYMSHLEIEPLEPLGAEDFDGVAVPTELF